MNKFYRKVPILARRCPINEGINFAFKSNSESGVVVILQQQSKIVKRESKNGQSAKFQKKIGSTNYVVSVRFSEKSVETMEDKLIRMLRTEVSRNA